MSSPPPAEIKVPRSMPVSGRVWKKTQQKRSSSMIKPSKSTKKKNTYAIRRATEQQLKEARELEQRIKREADDAKRFERERAEERKKQREINRLKAEIVQKISDPAKIKKMKRKQLRSIEMRDTVEVSK